MNRDAVSRRFWIEESNHKKSKQNGFDVAYYSLVDDLSAACRGGEPEGPRWTHALWAFVDDDAQWL